MSVVQSVGSDNGAGAPTLVITIASSGAGNCLGICFTSFNAPTLVQDSKGQTWTQTLNWDSQGYIYTFPNTASGVTSVTVTAASGQMVGIAWELDNVQSSSILDQTASTSQAAVTSWSSGNAPNTTVATVGVGFAYTFDTSGETYAAGTGWTAASGTGITAGYHGQSGNGVVFVEFQNFNATGAYAATGTNSTSVTIKSAIVLLKQSAAAAAVLMGAMCL